MGVARAAVWLAAGRLVRTASTILLPLVLVRVLTKPEFGIFRQADLAAALLVPFIILGLGKSIVYYLPRTDTARREEVSTPLVTIFIVAASVLVLSFIHPSLFSRLLGVVDMRLLALTAAAGAMAAAVTNAANQALISIDAARTSALMTATIGSLRAGTLLALAITSGSLRVIIVGLLAFSLLQTTISFLVLYKRGLLEPRIRKHILRRHLTFAGPLALSSAMQAWSHRFDRYIVSGHMGPAAFAVYSVGMPHVPFLPNIATSVRDAATPRYSALEARGQYREIAELYRKALNAVLPLYSLVTCFFMTCAQWIVPVLFTSAYVESIPIFRIFALSLMVEFLWGAEHVLRAMRAIRFLMMAVFAALAVRIVLVLAVVGTGSLPVIAGAQMLVSIILVASFHVYLRHRLQISWRELMPMEGIRIAIGSGLFGAAGTALFWLYAGDQLAAGFIFSIILWGGTIVFALWKQGIWRSIIPSLTGKRS